MVNKTISMFVPLLLLLLLVFMAASSDAVPVSRTLAMFDDEQEVLHGLYAQEAIGSTDWSDEVLKTEGFVERRMDIQTNDYPGTGANNHHNP